jgi:hypothetical protein
MALFLFLLTPARAVAGDGFHGPDLSATAQGVYSGGSTHAGFGFGAALDLSYGFSKWYVGVGGEFDWSNVSPAGEFTEADSAVVAEYAVGLDFGLTSLVTGRWVNTRTGETVSVEYTRARYKIGFTGGYSGTRYQPGGLFPFSQAAHGPYFGVKAGVLLTEHLGAEMRGLYKLFSGDQLFEERAFVFGLGLLWHIANL